MWSAFAAFAAAAQPIKVEVPPGDPLWATAAVAVGAALLGSAVGGYASFRASEALEITRRRARSQIRRKAKIYTPIRSELITLREACQSGTHLGTWLIVREEPPSLVMKPASLHLWKDLVDDGRAMTAASKKVRGLLNHVDECADALNREVLETRQLFSERGEAILTSLNMRPGVTNWVQSDTARLLRAQYTDLHVLDDRLASGPPPELRERFVEAWKADGAISKRTADVRRVDDALREALDAAIAELDAAMQRIADKYENESPRD